MRGFESVVAVALFASNVTGCALAERGLEAATDSGVDVTTGGGSSTSTSRDASSGSSSGSTHQGSTSASDAGATRSSGSASGSSVDPGSSTSISGSESGLSSGSGTSSSASASSDAGVDAGCTVDAGCYVVPAGGSWRLTMLASNQSTPCPANTTKYDEYEGPNTSSACACDCALTVPPTCPAGPITLAYDDNSGDAPACGTVGAALSTVSACTVNPYTGPGYQKLDLALTPPAATSGACAPSASTQGDVTYSFMDRICALNTLPCVSDVCKASFPSPYKVCVVSTGVQTCPGAPFTEQHVVGGPATFTCGEGSCGCKVNAVTCTGTVTFYSQGNCGGSATAVAADGQCQSPGFVSDNQPSYTYGATPLNPSCTPSGTSSAENVSLSQPHTVCCVP